MRRRIFLVCFGMIAGGVLLPRAHAQEGGTTGTFSVYQSQQPQLPVSFEYPADWQLEPSTGKVEAYTQVQIYGPASLDHRLRTYLVIRGVAPQSAGGRYAGLNEMVDSYRHTLQQGLQIDQELHVSVLGVPAIEVEVSGTFRLPWESPAAQAVAVKSQRIFLEKNGRLYELAWMATQEAAPEVEQVFSHLLHTLTVTP